MIVEVIKYLDGAASEVWTVTLGSSTLRNADQNTYASTCIMVLVKYAPQLANSRSEIPVIHG